ncbi:hypothetical protein [Vibrio chemaguriensis]
MKPINKGSRVWFLNAILFIFAATLTYRVGVSLYTKWSSSEQWKELSKVSNVHSSLVIAYRECLNKSSHSECIVLVRDYAQTKGIEPSEAEQVLHEILSTSERIQNEHSERLEFFSWIGLGM